MSDQPDPKTDAPAADSDDAREDKPKHALSGRAKLILLGIAIVAIVAGAIWFTRYQTHGKYQQTTNDARLEADAVTVAPRTTGYVAEVLVADNQDVVAGQPLVRIDPRDYRAQAAQAQAQIGVAAAQADNARA